MCGICGFVGFEDRSLARRINSTIAHRGPDDEGFFSDRNVELAIRRLSIIDLKTGNQPIHNEEENVWVVYNGEIYNYKKLRTEMEKKGHKFYTNSDTEVLVHLYEEYGPLFASRLDGMFGFAVWDSKKEELVLSRDATGIKPLYFYYNKKDNTLMFGSEIKAIIENREIAREIDPRSLDCFLTFGSVFGDGTLFKGIKKLLPGHALIWNKNGIEIKEYWNVKMRPKKEDENSLKRALAVKLQNSVEMQLMSDVPLGAFLSGGLDSSTVVALMSKRVKEPVKTFTIGFGEEDDEIDYAREVSEKFGTEHREKIVEYSEIPRIMPKLVWHYDDLTGDSAGFPTYLVSELAKKHVKVVLTGEGSDELFAGYNRYKPMSDYLKIVPKSISLSVFYNAVTIFKDDEKKGVFSGASNEPRKRHLDPYFKTSLDYMNQALMFGLKEVLPNQLLLKVDRATMASSIEARVPFLGMDIINFSTKLMPNLKMRGFQGKYLLRGVVADLLPNEIIKRKKQGFTPPVVTWFNNDLGEFAENIFSETKTEERQFINYKEVCKRFPSKGKFDDYKEARRFWHLLLFEMWYRRFFESK